ncbi:hypothetical protein DEU56DRAFT_85281 [Suillus clintonianus]|uniref:uncharacterized protein n=1 Tax=Suillus clintonianus TaxID=1904413 RepID=UPI001B879AE2|nr:uncharacterized protein DEU56DRAFT_85281 [Suillus clintonianus]KAG2148904.1 hypothetical protein DEU56DRAFT_85281 [Suillus clintonianus]
MLGIKSVTSWLYSSIVLYPRLQLYTCIPSPLFNMQFTLFASLAILCSAALAAPSDRRGGSDTLAEIIAYVDNDLNDVTVDVLKRGDTLAEVLAYVDHDLNDVTVDVLKRDDALIKVIMSRTIWIISP